MLLIGQYDSPFVRRVGIALTLYGHAFEHTRPSVFRNADEIARHNPLRRVPTLVLADGLVLTDSAAILDVLDDMAGRERALFPATGPARWQAVRVAALACGMAEKAVSLFYERNLHEVASDVWEARCITQIHETLDALEGDYAGRPGPYWGGAEIGHADIATACAWRFTLEAHPGLVPEGRHPWLAALSARCEALPAFIAIAQLFAPPTKG